MSTLVRAVLLLLLTATACKSQQPVLTWQGEWGAFDSPLATIRERLTISDCTDASCKFSVDVQTERYHCVLSSRPSFTLQSPNTAVAELPTDKPGQTCTLHLRRKDTAGAASITVTSEGEACAAYYCTSKTVNFNHNFPQRSKNLYTGPHSNECFLENAPARMATCLDPSLAGLEQKWQDLYAEYPLDGNAGKDPSPYNYAVRIDAETIQQCNTNATPAECLRTRWTADLAAMNAKRQAFIQGYTVPGDPADAERKAATIAGAYHHTSPNGDVQGNSFLTTDTLTITSLPAATIHFDAHLEFFNGHTCDLKGDASYRKDGTFVFDDDPSNAVQPGQVCKLAIIPTTNGVKFSDLTGNCQFYCGARGGWNGAGFLFTERVPTPTAKASTQANPSSAKPVR